METRIAPRSQSTRAPAPVLCCADHEGAGSVGPLSLSEPDPALERILVTGANGHLGRLLIRTLSNTGSPRPSLRAVVRSERAAAVLGELPDAVRPEIRVVDYSDVDALADAAQGCSAAVHFAGILRESSTSSYENAHEATCEALARAAEHAELRRIVYPSILGSHPGSGNACLASKGRAESVLLAAKTPALVLRLPMVLGPGDFVARALSGQARARVVPLLRGGASREQPIDAGDVVAAIIAGLSRPGLDDAALDLAGPESITRRELLERCAALYRNRPRVLPIPLALELALAFAFEKLLADPPLTRAMVGVLDHDDDVDAREACERLGIELTPLDETLRRCVGPEARAS